MKAHAPPISCTIPEKPLHANFDLGLSACTTRVRKTKCERHPKPTVRMPTVRMPTVRKGQQGEWDKSANVKSATAVRTTTMRKGHCAVTCTALPTWKTRVLGLSSSVWCPAKKRARQLLLVLEIPTFSAEAKVPYDKNLLEIEKEIAREEARADKPYMRKSTDRKAQISLLSWTNAFLICALRSADFLM